MQWEAYKAIDAQYDRVDEPEIVSKPVTPKVKGMATYIEISKKMKISPIDIQKILTKFQERLLERLILRGWE